MRTGIFLTVDFTDGSGVAFRCNIESLKAMFKYDAKDNESHSPIIEYKGLRVYLEELEIQE